MHSAGGQGLPRGRELTDLPVISARIRKVESFRSGPERTAHLHRLLVAVEPAVATETLIRLIAPTCCAHRDAPEQDGLSPEGAVALAAPGQEIGCGVYVS